MSAEQPPPSPARRHVLLALKLAVSIVLLAVLFERLDVGQLWATARLASIPWLVAGVGAYVMGLLASTWRWHLLLHTQQVDVRRRWLFSSFMVASFFNNFLPSNIGGDVIRITDTAKPARSKTLAATVVLMDRGLGLMALVLVAALGASAESAVHPAAVPICP